MAMTENPFESLKNALTSSGYHFSRSAQLAWIYGIIIGWTSEDFEKLYEAHKWTDDMIARLRRLHDRYAELTSAPQPLTLDQLRQAAAEHTTIWIQTPDTVITAQLHIIRDRVEAYVIGEDAPGIWDVSDYGRTWRAYDCPLPWVIT